MKKLFFLMVVIFIAASCGVYTNVTVTVDHKSDFLNYKTFAWLPDETDSCNSPYNNQVIRNNIRNYLGKQFIERGYTLELDTPDILLQVSIINNKKNREMVYPAYPASFYYKKYYFASDYYIPYPTDYYYKGVKPLYCNALGYCIGLIDYMEGSITLNVIDRKQSLLIWSCTAKGDIYDPSLINRSIHPAIKAIIKNYPLRPLGNQRETSKTPTVVTGGL